MSSRVGLMVLGSIALLLAIFGFVALRPAAEASDEAGMRPNLAGPPDRVPLQSGAAPGSAQPSSPLPTAARATTPGAVRVNNDPTVLSQNETAIAVNPGNPMHVVAAFNDCRMAAYNSSCAYAYSFDQGKTWGNGLLPLAFEETQPDVWVPFDIAGDPSIAVDGDGNVYICCLQTQGQMSADWMSTPAQDPGTTIPNSAIYVYTSTDGGQSFGPPVRVFVIDNVGSQCPDPPAVGSESVDKPYIAVNAFEGTPGYGNVYVTWTKLMCDRDEIWCAWSVDGGQSFSLVPTPISQNVADDSNNGSMPAIDPEGNVVVAWRDEPMSGNNGMWITRSTSIAPLQFGSPPSLVSPHAPLPGLFEANPSVCGILPITSKNCFRLNSFPSLAIDPRSQTDGGGTIYVAWADYGAGNADIRIASVSPPSPTQLPDLSNFAVHPVVNDDSGTADQFFPWITVDPSGRVHTIFYDRRRNNPVDDIDVYYAFSDDPALGFTNQRISDDPFDPRLDGWGAFLGDYNGIASSSEGVHLFWAETTAGAGITLGHSDVYTLCIPLEE